MTNDERQSPQENDDDRRRRYAQEKRASLQKRYPEEFRDGANRAFRGITRYPPKFLTWPLERRNAWFAGFNVGYQDRVKTGLASPIEGDANGIDPEDGDA